MKSTLQTDTLRDIQSSGLRKKLSDLTREIGESNTIMLLEHACGMLQSGMLLPSSRLEIINAMDPEKLLRHLQCVAVGFVAHEAAERVGDDPGALKRLKDHVRRILR